MSGKGQSQRMSVLETGVSVVVGYFLTVCMQYFLYPLFGITVPVKEALFISIVIVLIAFAKNFAVRRVFNTLYIRSVSVKREG